MSFLVWLMSHLLTWKEFITYTAAKHKGAINRFPGLSCLPSIKGQRSLNTLMLSMKPTMTAEARNQAVIKTGV